MKKDLSELKETVQQESVSYISSTTSAVSSTASYIKETVSSLALEDELAEAVAREEENIANNATEPKPSTSKITNSECPSSTADSYESITIKAAEKVASKVTSVFSSLIDALSPQGFDDSDDEVILFDGKEIDERVVIPRDRWDLLLRCIQTDPETYTRDPDAAEGEFETYAERFNVDDHVRTIQRLVEAVPEIVGYHQKLVSDELTNELFWQRYFFRVEQLKEIELARAKNAQSSKMAEGSSGIANSVQPAKSLESELLENAPSPVTSEGSSNGKSSTKSEDWEKADLTDIVDEATKRLGDKLNAMAPPESTRSDEEWEFE